jgi:NMD protein affecting ribosome stability and mRNA decay
MTRKATKRTVVINIDLTPQLEAKTLKQARANHLAHVAELTRYMNTMPCPHCGRNARGQLVI